MSDAQLRWHLLREVCQMAMDNTFYPDIACLGPLAMSGRGPAEAVKLILSTIEVSHDSDGIYVRLNYNDRLCLRMKPVYLQNVALRWSRVVNIDDFFIEKLRDRLVPLLADFNSIEKLTLHTPSSSVMPIIEACSNLCHLKCRPEVFVALFEREKTVFSKLRTVEIVQFRGVWRDLFEPWTKRPEQCPVLESLTVWTLCGMEDLSTSIPTGVIPSLKSLNIEWDAKCCSGIPFSMFVSMCKLFPNLETAACTLIAQCKHRHMKLSEVYNLFKEFDLKAKLNFTYYHAHKYEYNWSKLLRLRDRLAKRGTITAVPDDLRNCCVITTYPNKTMMLHSRVDIADAENYYKHQYFDDSEDSG